MSVTVAGFVSNVQQIVADVQALATAAANLPAPVAVAPSYTAPKSVGPGFAASPKVGNPISLNYGSPIPAATSFTVVVKINGVQVSTSPNYTPQPGDSNHILSVLVTPYNGTLAGDIFNIPGVLVP